MKQIGSQEARDNFRVLLDEAQRDEFAEISRHGKPAAVLVPAEWYEHQRGALAAYGGDPPVSAREVRHRVVTLAGLLDGMRKYIHPEIPQSTFAEYWQKINKAVGELAGLLPENADVPPETIWPADHETEALP